LLHIITCHKQSDEATLGNLSAALASLCEIVSCKSFLDYQTLQMSQGAAIN
jgi:hypothetical protein